MVLIHLILSVSLYGFLSTLDIENIIFSFYYDHSLAVIDIYEIYIFLNIKYKPDLITHPPMTLRIKSKFYTMVYWL